MVIWCLVFFPCIPMPVAAAAADLRNGVRKKYQLPGNALQPFSDCCLFILCEPCSLMQLANEMQERGIY